MHIHIIAQPMRKPRYQKKPNGCGSYGFSFDLNIMGLEFNQCCHEHDLCYGTCNAVKETCDKKLYECARLDCSAKLANNSVKHMACKGLAKLMHKVIRTTGCMAYRRDQNLACHCENNNELYDPVIMSDLEH